MEDKPTDKAGQPGVVQPIEVAFPTNELTLEFISMLISEDRKKLNELIYANQELKARVDRAEKVSLKLIGQVAAHKHLPDGKPAIEIELLNIQ